MWDQPVSVNQRNPMNFLVWLPSKCQETTTTYIPIMLPPTWHMQYPQTVGSTSNPQPSTIKSWCTADRSGSGCTKNSAKNQTRLDLETLVMTIAFHVGFFFGKLQCVPTYPKKAVKWNERLYVHIFGLLYYLHKTSFPVMLQGKGRDYYIQIVYIWWCRLLLHVRIFCLHMTKGVTCKFMMWYRGLVVWHVLVKSGGGDLFCAPD